MRCCASSADSRTGRIRSIVGGQHRFLQQQGEHHVCFATGNAGAGFFAGFAPGRQLHALVLQGKAHRRVLPAVRLHGRLKEPGLRVPCELRTLQAAERRNPADQRRHRPQPEELVGLPRRHSLSPVVGLLAAWLGGPGLWGVRQGTRLRRPFGVPGGCAGHHPLLAGLSQGHCAGKRRSAAAFAVVVRR